MLQNILASAVTSFSVVLILMFIDLVTGLCKSFKLHKSITSSRLRQTINKTVIYFIIMIIGGCLVCAGEASISLLFTVFICLIESISICENLIIMFPDNKIVKQIQHLLKLKVDEKINK